MDRDAFTGLDDRRRRISNPAAEVGTTPPVRSSVLGVRKTVWASSEETGVAILETHL